MTLTQKTKAQHVSEAQAHLIEQFKGKANFLALIESFVNQAGDAETASFTVLNNTLALAVGASLDGFGSIVGESRQGRNDSDYRDAIEVRILINLSSGTIEEIIEILVALNPGADVEVTEYFPAAFVAEYVDTFTGDGNRIAALMKSARPASVNGQLVWSEEDDDLTFAPSAASFTDAVHGLSNATQTTGGYLAAVSEG